MIRLDDEAVVPEVQMPVAHGVDQTDELVLISSEGSVPMCDGSAKEGDRMPLLYEHGAKPMGGRIALDDEGLGEVRHGKDQSRGDRGLECREGCGHLLALGEPLLLEESR